MIPLKLRGILLSPIDQFQGQGLLVADAIEETVQLPLAEPSVNRANESGFGLIVRRMLVHATLIIIFPVLLVPVQVALVPQIEVWRFLLGPDPCTDGIRSLPFLIAYLWSKSDVERMITQARPFQDV